MKKWPLIVPIIALALAANKENVKNPQKAQEIVKKDIKKVEKLPKIQEIPKKYSACDIDLSNVSCVLDTMER